MPQRRAVVVVPVKGCAEGKSRLAPVLSPEERARVVLWMLERVLHAARRGDFPVWVVGGDEPVARLCQRPGTRWSHDVGGLNRSVRAALDEAARWGYPAALVVPADVPLVEPEDLSELAEAVADPRTVALVPSVDGGTNALGQALPPPLEPSFGPGSYRRHRASAERAGLRVVTLRLPRLEWDVDTPDDLRRLSQAVRPPGAAGPAGLEPAGGFVRGS